MLKWRKVYLFIWREFRVLLWLSRVCFWSTLQSAACMQFYQWVSRKRFLSTDCTWLSLWKFNNIWWWSMCTSNLFFIGCSLNLIFQNWISTGKSFGFWPFWIGFFVFHRFYKHFLIVSGVFTMRINKKAALLNDNLPYWNSE